MSLCSLSMSNCTMYSFLDQSHWAIMIARGIIELGISFTGLQTMYALDSI